jgi:translation elongation factor EF-Ts
MDKDTLSEEIEGYENELAEIERLASYPICYFPQTNQLRKIELKSLIAEKRKQLGRLVELEKSEQKDLEIEGLKAELETERLQKQVEETKKITEAIGEHVNALEEKWLEKANSDLDFLIEQYEIEINKLKSMYAEKERKENIIEGHKNKLLEIHDMTVEQFALEKSKVCNKWIEESKKTEKPLTVEDIKKFFELNEFRWIKDYEKELSELNSPILNSEIRTESLWKRIEKLNKKIKRFERLERLENLQG